LTSVIWYILIPFNLVVFLVEAQPTGLSVYQFPKQIPLAYHVNVESELTNMPYCAHSEIKKSDFSTFTRNIVENRIHQINEGEIYFDWIEAELYLKRLLNRLLPDSLKNKKAINIYIRRDPAANAYSSYDATIYINVGLLADIKSEAALAFVLGHELAHYIGKHQLHNYQLFKQNQKKEDRKFKKLVHANKLLELEADKMAAEIIQQAGFKVQHAHSVFDLIYANENLFKKERIENVKQTIDQTENITDIKDSAIFKKIVALAKYEKLQVLLNQFKYTLCAKYALQYYAEDNNLKFSPYYIVEAIRRHLLIHPDDLGKAAFDPINLQVFNSPGFQDIEKNTYKYLVDYFLMPEFIEEVPDLLLSKALYAYQQNKPVASKILKEYIELKTTKQYSGLAKFLRKDIQQPENVFNKSIAVIENIGAYNLKNLDTPVFDVGRSLLLNERYNSNLKKNLSTKFPKQSINLQRDLSETDYNKTTLYKQLSVAVLLAQNIKKTSPIDLHEILYLLHPDAFIFLNENRINEIAFFKLNSFKRESRQSINGVINPLSWIGKAFRHYASGSKKHFYTVEHINLNQSSGTVFYEVDTIKYKLNLPHLLNTMYESIKNAKNCHENLVEN